MNARVLILALALAGPISVGCALKRTTAQTVDTGYLSFRGERGGLLLQVDENEPRSLAISGRDVRFEIAPGRRHVRVRRGKDIVVDRVVFVSHGEVFEVVLP